MKMISKKYMIVAGFVLLVVTLFAIWAVILPVINQTRTNESVSDLMSAQIEPVQDDEVQDQGSNSTALDVDSSPTVVSRGVLRGLNGTSASGQAKLLKIGDRYVIRLEDDFTVTPGPDLFVAVGADGQLSELIAPLKGNSGGQNYDVPVSVDPESIDQVYIHCRAFAYSFGVANLSNVN